MKQVVAGLGCEGLAVSAELYKLLVYDTGGFFLAHRDTEKADGMFGTLVVVLPSAHRGGELVIHHAGREATVDLSSAEVSEVSFAAFYADCEHEVRPVTEGKRVCLVYNLIEQRGAKRKASSLEAPDYEKQIAAAAELLKKNLAEPGAPAKIAWLLEHQYSPDGLSFAGLKSADAARVKVLAQAAERADCAAHLGIVHIEESGSAQENYDFKPRGRGWYRDDDVEETENAGSDDFEVIEVCDWRHYVSQWRDRRDQPVEFGEIPLAPGELLPAGALDDEKADEQRLMEASGNEGASFERSYHRAALVIWRRERYAEVLLQAGVAAALPLLKERIAACVAKDSGAGVSPASSKTGGDSPGFETHGQDARATATARKEAVALARRLVAAWKDAPEYGGYGQPARPEKRDVMLRLLTQLGDAALLEEFIAEAVARDYDGSDNAALVDAVPLLGAKKTGTLFSELMRRQMPHFHAHCVDLLNALTFSGDLAVDEKWRNALRPVAEAAVSRLDEVGKKPRENEWQDWRVTEKTRAVDAALVAKLLDALGGLDAPALRAAAVAKFAARPAVFDPVTILAPALGLARERDDATARLWTHCVEFLLERSGQPPESPADWRQDVKLTCSCADCRELQAFTRDPVEQTHRFRVKKERRQHLHQMIEQHNLDMTHVTDRKGSPQTLVCTKDRRSYQRRCDQYRKDIAALNDLSKLADQSVAASALGKIEATRALAAAWRPAKT